MGHYRYDKATAAEYRQHQLEVAAEWLEWVAFQLAKGELQQAVCGRGEAEICFIRGRFGKSAVAGY